MALQSDCRSGILELDLILRCKVVLVVPYTTAKGAILVRCAI